MSRKFIDAPVVVSLWRADTHKCSVLDKVHGAVRILYRQVQHAPQGQQDSLSLSFFPPGYRKLPSRQAAYSLFPSQPASRAARASRPRGRISAIAIEISASCGPHSSPLKPSSAPRNAKHQGDTVYDLTTPTTILRSRLSGLGEARDIPCRNSLGELINYVNTADKLTWAPKSADVDAFSLAAIKYRCPH